MGSCASIPTDGSEDANSEHGFGDASASALSHGEPATQNGPPAERAPFRQNGSGRNLPGTGPEGRRRGSIRFDERTLPEGLAGKLAGLAGKPPPALHQGSMMKERIHEQRRKLLEEHGEFLVSLVAILEYQVGINLL